MKKSITLCLAAAEILFLPVAAQNIPSAQPLFKELLTSSYEQTMGFNNAGQLVGKRKDAKGKLIPETFTKHGEPTGFPASTTFPTILGSQIFSTADTELYKSDKGRFALVARKSNAIIGYGVDSDSPSLSDIIFLDAGNKFYFSRVSRSDDFIVIMKDEQIVGLLDPLNKSIRGVFANLEIASASYLAPADVASFKAKARAEYILHIDAERLDLLSEVARIWKFDRTKDNLKPEDPTAGRVAYFFFGDFKRSAGKARKGAAESFVIISDVVGRGHKVIDGPLTIDTISVGKYFLKLADDGKLKVYSRATDKLIGTAERQTPKQSSDTKK